MRAGVELLKMGAVEERKTEQQHTEQHWITCPDCQGRGRKSRRLSKKVRRAYQNALEAFEKNGRQGAAPLRPKGHQDACAGCEGSGLVRSATKPRVDTENFPHVAIIGGGIGRCNGPTKLGGS